MERIVGVLEINIYYRMFGISPSNLNYIYTNVSYRRENHDAIKLEDTVTVYREWC